MSVAVVTDSTACLPAESAADSAVTVQTVPMPVTINGRWGREGVDVTTADMVDAFAQRRVDVSTSRPAPEEFVGIYRKLLEAGATGVVSVHLSRALSGTADSAEAAAGEFDGQVQVVDSANAGMGLGFCVLAAVGASEQGLGLEVAAAAARACAKDVDTYFYVDTLEFLRRGGRIGAASALLGTALAVKPILHVSKGEVVLREKVRTSARGLSRLEDLVVEAGDGEAVDVALHHLQSPQQAQELQERLRQRLGSRLHEVYVTEVGAVIAAHCGPGLLGVVVRRRK